MVETSTCFVTYHDGDFNFSISEKKGVQHEGVYLLKNGVSSHPFPLPWESFKSIVYRSRLWYFKQYLDVFSSSMDYDDVGHCLREVSIFHSSWERN